MALADSEDKWSRAAFLSGLRGRESEVVAQLSQHSDLPPSPGLAWELGHYLARRERAGILGGHDSTAKAYNRVATGSSWHLPALAGVIEGVGFRDFAEHPAAALKSLGLDDETRTGLLTTARQELASDRASVLEATSAITVLVLATTDGIQAGINLIKPGQAPEVLRHLLSLTIELGQLDALEALTSEPLWSSLSPTARSQVIDGLLQREATAGLLLRSLQAGRVPPATLSLNQRDRLQRQLPAGLKEEAARLFTAVGGDRRQVYEQFKDVAAMKGDASKGRELFQLHCAACHRLDRAGFNVGPDLFGIRSQPKEAILLHVLVPNAEVYPEFAAVTLETRDDRSLTGIVRAETADAITLVQAQGLVTTLRRDEITSRRTADTSLMPDGFEQVLSRQELADLLAGLRGE
jgi:putative heme-binding domain-containing protein